MSSVQCNQCGLVQFAATPNCKSCGAPFGIVTAPLIQSKSATSPLVSDGYVFPPPPFASDSAVWRENKKLVMRREAQLPDRCIKCNEPAYGGRLKRKLSWHHPALYLLILVALLLYLLIALIVRKTATVEIPLCERHLAKRRRDLWISWTTVLAGLGGFFLAVAFNDGVFALLGSVLLLVGVIYTVIATRLVVPTRIDESYVWLTSVNADYLSSLPTFPGK